MEDWFRTTEAKKSEVEQWPQEVRGEIDTDEVRRHVERLKKSGYIPTDDEPGIELYRLRRTRGRNKRAVDRAIEGLKKEAWRCRKGRLPPSITMRYGKRTAPCRSAAIFTGSSGRNRHQRSYQKHGNVA